MRLPDQHLSAGELESLGKEGGLSGELGDQLRPAREHAETCPACRRRLEVYPTSGAKLEKLRAPHGAQKGPDCPSIDVWLKLAGGLLNTTEQERYTGHAAQCDYCGPVLRSVVEDFSAAVTESEAAALRALKNPAQELPNLLSDSTNPVDERSAARKIPKATLTGKRWFGLPAWQFSTATLLTFIALAFLLFKLGIFETSTTASEIDQLLAKSYGEQRTIELRIPHGLYGPIRVVRSGHSSQFNSPPPLLEAEGLIARELEAKPADPELLRNRAEAELLRGHYTEAISTLEMFIKAGSPSSAALDDLGVAYFESAEGSSPGTNEIDYERSFQALSEALKISPEDAATLFNRAIVDEKLELLDQAMADWQHFLRVNHDGNWGSEAQQRLQSLQDRKKTRSLSLPLVEDDARAYQELSQASVVDSIYSEAFLEIAVRDWVPLVGPSASSSGPLRKLAKALEVNHNDFWLTDLLNSPLSSRAIDLLRLAISADNEGDPQRGARFASSAASTFSTIHNAAGFARSRFELLFALHRQAKAPECDREASVLAQVLRVRHYAWLEAQTLIERGICKGMTGQFDQSWRLASLARERAEDSHYQCLRLRAVGLEASLHTATGRLRESWQVNEEGLREFWEGVFPPERGFQFYSDLEFAAEESAQWEVAVALEREAIALLNESKHVDFKASAHFQLAKAERMLGKQDAAAQEFAVAYKLFDSLPNTPTTRMYKANVEVSLAAAEAEEDALSVATRRLDEMGDISQFSNFLIQLGYWKARAVISRRKDRVEEERTDLTKAVLIGNQGFKALKGEKDRWDWRRQVGDVYRRLLEIEVRAPHDPVQALADWEHYRNAENTGDLSGDATGNSEAKANLVRLAAGLHNASLLAFAVFPRLTEAWIADNRGIQEFILAADSGLTDRVQEFARECSDPKVPLAQVRHYGTLLYDELIAPLESGLDSQRVLYIEADELGRLPWAALVADSGQYFGSLYSIAVTPGLFFRSRLAGERVTRGVGRAVIAVPSAVTFDGEQYPPPPQAQAEVQAVKSTYPDSAVLQGGDASVPRLLQYLPHVSVLHFAGHAISREYGGELLLSEANAETFSSAVISRLTFKSLKLVVLSACSTAVAEGEAARDPNGLVRAFLRSGADTVIASRWDADSVATTDFMRQLYSRLPQTSSVPSVVRLAREHVRTERDWSHPYYWAAFEAFQTPDVVISE